MNISVLGLGKLGLCTASCFAMKKHHVIGVDKNEFIVEELKGKRCPINETNLENILDKAWDFFEVTYDVGYAINNSDITLIVIPTPSLEDGSFTNEYVVNALKEIAPYIKNKESFHIVDVVSTVMPGSSESEFKPLLETLTNKRCGVDFGLVYNPEFIALGSVVYNFLNPDMVLIGASDNISADTVEQLYLQCCENVPNIRKMSLINAEITKISLNCYVTMKISYANELASICERVPGADIDVITNAIGADTRVGVKYLTGGLGFAGPCFPRDNLAFQRFADNYGAEAKLGKSVVAINHSIVDRLYELLTDKISKAAQVSILGMSYKPNTHVLEESQSVELANKLLKNGYKLRLHDPKALAFDVDQAVGVDSLMYEDVYECVTGCDAIVFMTNWSEYRELDIKKIVSLASKDVLLLDSWRIFKDMEVDREFGIKYLGLGMGRVCEK